MQDGLPPWLAKEKKKPKPARKPKTPHTLRRFTARLKETRNQEVTTCRIFVSDLATSDLSLFCSHQIDLGSLVEIILERPRNCTLKAEVIWCALSSHSTKIVSGESFAYRLGLKLLFDNAEHEAEYREIWALLTKPRHQEAA